MQHVDALLLSAKALAARPSHCAGLLARLMALDIRSRWEHERLYSTTWSQLPLQQGLLLAANFGPPRVGAAHG